MDNTMISFTGLKTHDGSVSQKNTEVWVVTNASNPFSGQSKVYYDRLNLANLANFTFTKNSANVGVSVYTILDVIRNQTGITFTSDDLVDHAVVDTGNGLQVQLEAKPTSLGFTGTFNLPLKNLPSIATLFTTNALVGF